MLHVMKKLVVLLVVVVGLSLSSCAPNWLLVNSSGVATYNRHTGQVELLWENKTAEVHEVHDTIYVESPEKR